MSEEPKQERDAETRFYDQASGREMKIIHDGPYKNWLCYHHPDGQWVTLREATDQDIAAINLIMPPTADQHELYCVSRSKGGNSLTSCSCSEPPASAGFN